MQGFPAPPAYRVDALNWQQHSSKIWSFQHTREPFPTRRLQPEGPVWSLRGDVASLERLQMGDAKTPLSLPEFLARNHIDAALVLHRGRIIDERYLNGMRPQTPHLMFSATKSMVGLMAVTAVAEGRLDPTATVGQVLPELADSAWGPATAPQARFVLSSRRQPPVLRHRSQGLSDRRQQRIAGRQCLLRSRPGQRGCEGRAAQLSLRHGVEL